MSELIVPKEIADERKKAELAYVKALGKKRENRRRRSHLGDGVQVVCGFCKKGNVTLHKVGGHPGDQREGYRCEKDLHV